MEFEWDQKKAQKVWEKRGIRFEVACQIFAGARIELSSDRAAERRWITIGEIDGRVLAVVYTLRGDVIRLITARRARENEERSYHAYVAGRGQGEVGQD
jgi:uncharacterized protein